MRGFVLAVNPGSGWTQVGLFDASRAIVQHVERHAERALRAVEVVPARVRMVRAFLDHAGLGREALAAVVAPGGLLRPVETGTYLVEETMVREIERAELGDHVANIGAPLAKEIADDHGCPAFVVDPVSADDLDPVARFSGLHGISRRSVCHTLNMRAVSRRHAIAVQRPVDELRLVIVHLDDCTSVGAYRDGRIVDVVSSIDEGPFSANHCGALPTTTVVDLCFAPGATAEAVRGRLFSNGGLQSYLGTRDLREAEERAERGDGKAMVVLDAMAYQVAKAVGELAAALGGEVDAVLVTGNAAHATAVVNGMCRRVEWIAPVFVYPGDEELAALAQGAWRVLRGEEQAKRYA